MALTALSPLSRSEAGWYTLRGYAYTGGGKQITRVEVSFDSGYTWKLATLLHHEKPNRYGKVLRPLRHLISTPLLNLTLQYWCWRLWEMEASHEDIRVSKEIVMRAWDSSTNTQVRMRTDLSL